MRILITGATGFIGRHLVARLQTDHEIYALVRRLPTQPHPAVRYLQQDLTAPLNRDLLPTHLDAIIHQAAVIDTPSVDDATPFLVNVVATWRLLNYATQAQVRTFLHASTGGVYGCRNRPFHESDPHNPLDLYSLTKAQAELAVQSAPGTFSKIILRYFFPYGPGTPNPIPSYIQRAVTGATIAIPEGGGPRFNPIHIDDAVEATVRALALQGEHILNIAGSEITTFGGIAQQAAQLVGRTAQIEEVPLAATIPYYRADLVAATEQMTKLLHFRPKISLATGIGELVGASANVVVAPDKSGS